jgi:RNA polymerase sigma-70 factor (ECF subfamily)
MSVHDDTATSDAATDEPATAEQLARLEAALLTLPRFRREVFLAHRIDNLSYAEIADRTGASVPRIEREMARAIYGLHCAMEGRPLRRSWWRW